MISDIITVTASDYSAGLVSTLLNTIGEYHIYNFSISEESSTGDIMIAALKHLDIPWIMSLLLLMVCVYCSFRLVSALISRF